MIASRSGTGAVTPAAADLPASERGEVGRQRLIAVSGILGALAASSCCIVPLVLFSIGIGGAWIGNLTALAPYKPLLSRAPQAFSDTASTSFIGSPGGPVLMALPAHAPFPAASFSSRSGSRPCS